jgi:hypothetical protein
VSTIAALSRSPDSSRDAPAGLVDARAKRSGVTLLQRLAPTAELAARSIPEFVLDVLPLMECERHARLRSS